MKLSFKKDDLFFSSLARKHKVAVFGCPLSFAYNNNELILQVSGVVVGKNQNKFIKDLKKHPRTIALESHNDFVVASYKTKKIFSWLKNHHIVHSAHLSIDFDGKEVLIIESFQKIPLLFLLTFLKARYSASLISINQRETSTIPVLRGSIKLTTQQRFAFELALKEGYYQYPRKISVLSLSKKANLSFSTFQQHLRKAESKLLPTL